MKLRPEQKQDSEEVKVVYDDNAGEVEIEAVQIVHTPMGTTVKPVEFKRFDEVETIEETKLDNVTIPKGIKLTVFGCLGDDMYDVLGPEGLRCELHANQIEKI